MNRRQYLKWLGGLSALALPVSFSRAASGKEGAVMKLNKSKADWAALLPEDAYRVLFEEDTERAVQGRALLGHEEFGQLHQGGDDQNKREQAQKFQMQGLEDEMLQQPADTGRHGQYKGGGHGHTDGRLHLVGDPHK